MQPTSRKGVTAGKGAASKSASCFILLAILLATAACSKALPARAEFVLGTVCSINLYEYGSQKLYSLIFERLREIDRTMGAKEGILHGLEAPPFQGSLEVQPSFLVLINQNAGIAPVKVSDDLLDVLEKAVYYAEISNGAFDPTIGPLVNLWGIGTETEKIPEPGEIAQALPLINWQDLIIDRGQGTAFLRRRGMALDLGGIAKGYAADEAVRIVREASASHAIIDLGGNIAAMGTRSASKGGAAPTPWRIGVQDPLGERNAYIGILSISDKSVVTSGVYERYFESGGRRYHHILSTTDGYPVDKGLLSVTIVADQSMDADGLSTAVFALGFAQGLELAEKLPYAEAIFIFADRSVYITDGLMDSFTLTNDDYTILIPCS